MPISCAACRYENSESAKFCLKCGATISLIELGAPVPMSVEQSGIINLNSTMVKSTSFGSIGTTAPIRRPPPPPPVFKTKPEAIKDTTSAPIVKSNGSGGLVVPLLIIALLMGGGFLYFKKGDESVAALNPDAPTSTPSSPAPAPVPAPATQSAVVKESFISTVPSGFSVEAPGEARAILTSMILDAMNPMKLAEAKGALEQFPKPISGDRKAARALNEKGLQAFREEKYLDAIEIFKQALAADGADVEIRNNYVYALAKAQKNVEAEREAGILLTYAPGRSTGWANLGEIYANKGQTNLASLALIVAFQFSNHKDKTIIIFKEKSNDTDNPVFAESAKMALDRLSNQ
jgi:Tfp pilus assembly protein PilF